MHKDFHYKTWLLGYQQFPKGYQFMVTSTLDESIQQLIDKMEQKSAKIKDKMEQKGRLQLGCT